MKIISFRDLDAWQVGMALAETVYQIAAKLPVSERYELSSQLRRAAISVPSNVAEGHATRLRGRYRHHARLALGSLGEISTQLELARRFGYIAETERIHADALVDRTRQLLNGVVRDLNRQLRTAGLP